VQAAALERLKALQPKALNRLEALIDLTEFPSVAFQAVKAVIDWTEGKAVETVKAEIRSASDLSDEELAEKAQALIAQLRNSQ
jgi:hypothetical protein